ncbi:hypothetical protein QBC39DRAFT_69108 [Podospora conica]|nr:hypothetical protein QBC39DRAFT_69108 [Schizothecium conicum]
MRRLSSTFIITAISLHSCRRRRQAVRLMRRCSRHHTWPPPASRRYRRSRALQVRAAFAENGEAVCGWRTTLRLAGRIRVLDECSRHGVSSAVGGRMPFCEVPDKTLKFGQGRNLPIRRIQCSQLGSPSATLRYCAEATINPMPRRRWALGNDESVVVVRSCGDSRAFWGWVRSCSRASRAPDLDGKGVGSNRHIEESHRLALDRSSWRSQPFADRRPSCIRAASRHTQPSTLIDLAAKIRSTVGPTALFRCDNTGTSARPCRAARRLTAQGPMARGSKPRTRVPSGCSLLLLPVGRWA